MTGIGKSIFEESKSRKAVQTMETAKATVQAEVLDQLHRRKMQRLQNDFRYEIHE